ncbi:DHS-like NAD/FAD-binding domain-containing protein [Elsinoe ampelina]|uniref:NAD-dependent protein deacetylase n=1 Tax=Elsinoe ampelina TaxID=302913 RepID=A0A6A6FYV6_9PEZI|nr:DHS-like NAD/FAD-binding domain-containing protein [Elsinoe ampelina]
MGQDSSTPIDESVPPETLTSRTLDGLAAYIKSGRAKKIVIMAGAGISTSAGIPDFRSPDTGLYANLARLNLPFAEAVFDIGFFRQNPLPFYTLAKELYPGKYRPTVTHSFFRLLQDKGLLLKVFTQNIDCLEREAGVKDEMIVEAHGSFAKQSCIECKRGFPDKEMKGYVERGKVPKCKDCNGLVKPEIVFFGEQLPEVFHKNRELPARADLCIVLGTSLQVQPFASLPSFCGDGVPRVLINKEQVGGLGSRTDDVLMLGDCDQGVRKLAEACGWADELEALWAKTAPKNAGDLGREQATEPRSKDEKVQDEVDKLTKEVEDTLSISKWHTDRVRQEHIDEDRKKAGASSEGAAKSRPTGGSSDTMHYDGQMANGLSHVFPHLEKPSL